MLLDAVPPARRARDAVAGAALVRVLAVAQLLVGALEREHEVRGQRLVALEPPHDRGVVRGGAGERLERERAPGRVGERAAVGAQLVEHAVVLLGAR